VLTTLAFDIVVVVRLKEVVAEKAMVVDATHVDTAKIKDTAENVILMSITDLLGWGWLSSYRKRCEQRATKEKEDDDGKVDIC
jgi:hypothetical protein